MFRCCVRMACRVGRIFLYAFTLMKHLILIKNDFAFFCLPTDQNKAGVIPYSSFGTPGHFLMFRCCVGIACPVGSGLPWGHPIGHTCLYAFTLMKHLILIKNDVAFLCLPTDPNKAGVIPYSSFGTPGHFLMFRHTRRRRRVQTCTNLTSARGLRPTSGVPKRSRAVARFVVGIARAPKATCPIVVRI